MHSSTRKLTAPLLVAIVACLALVATSTAGATTNSDVKRAFNALSGASGAYAYNVTDGKAIAGRNQARARIIASNAKLFTGAAVLARYGTGGRFSTGVFATGSLVGGVLSGDLYLRGGGDPLFGNQNYVTKYFGSRATLEQLAEDLKALGITRVSGTIYGDQSAFDARRGTSYSGWRSSSDIGGLLGGLIVNKGWASGRYQGDPPLYAAKKLRLTLRDAGMSVTTKTGSATTPTSARRLAAVRSLPTSALVRQMNKPSNNYLAEFLVKNLALAAGAADDDSDGGAVPIGAHPASTNSGATRARRFAATLGSRVQLADGSGLSRRDRAAPREVVDLLRGMTPLVAFKDFRASLPIAGVDGTLASRMRRGSAYKQCQAKTGTLSNVSSLSGYCTTSGGDLVAFSILQNSVAPATARAQQDRVAANLAALE